MSCKKIQSLMFLQCRQYHNRCLLISFTGALATYSNVGRAQREEVLEQAEIEPDLSEWYYAIQARQVSSDVEFGDSQSCLDMFSYRNNMSVRYITCAGCAMWHARRGLSCLL